MKEALKTGSDVKLKEEIPEHLNLVEGPGP